MAVKVVDASALAALLFGEPEAEVVARSMGLGLQRRVSSVLNLRMFASRNAGVIPICAKHSSPHSNCVAGWASQKPPLITGTSLTSRSSPA